jgi:hypothetical protein
LEKTKEKKRKIRKVEKKSNFLKKRKKKTKKKGKVRKKIGKESPWITVVIHSEMCVGKHVNKLFSNSFSVT